MVTVKVQFENIYKAWAFMDFMSDSGGEDSYFLMNNFLPKEHMVDKFKYNFETLEITTE